MESLGSVPSEIADPLRWDEPGRSLRVDEAIAGGDDNLSSRSLGDAANLELSGEDGEGQRQPVDEEYAYDDEESSASSDGDDDSSTSSDEVP
jgi:hypothetical protein